MIRKKKKIKMPDDWRKNKDIKYHKYHQGEQKIFEADEETSKVIDGFLQRGLYTLSITRRDITLPDGSKKEHYDIKPVNEAGDV